MFETSLQSYIENYYDDNFVGLNFETSLITNNDNIMSKKIYMYTMPKSNVRSLNIIIKLKLKGMRDDELSGQIRPYSKHPNIWEAK